MSDQMHIDSLWKRFLKGDDRAYTELYNLYIDDLFAYGMHFTTNRESVKDCIQEVFISLYKDRSKQRKVNNIKNETASNNVARVKKLLQVLSPKQNEVIYYRYVEEMSYDEIGELMHMNNQSVRNLVHRSILKIRELMHNDIFVRF